MPAYKLAGAAVVLFWTVVRVYYWYRARGRTTVVSLMTMRRRVLLATVSVTLAPIYLYYFTEMFDTSPIEPPLPIRWIGVAVMALGVAGFTWSHAALGRNWTVDVSLSAEQGLVTSGPYRWVRHPMYACLLLMAVGLTLATLHPLVGPPFGVAVLALYLERVDAEEQMMVERFGERYTAYAQRTHRLIP